MRFHLANIEPQFSRITQRAEDQFFHLRKSKGGRLLVAQEMMVACLPINFRRILTID
jgi:hypothetical protein